MADPKMAASADQEQAPRPVATPSPFNRIFFGDDGMRVIWRLLIFIVISRALSILLFKLCEAIGLGEHFQFTRLTPADVGLSHLIVFLAIAIAALVMARVERRAFESYGLPPRLAFRTDFWLGGAIGFFAISSSLLLMFLFHGFRVSGLAIHGEAILMSAVYWGLAFMIVGVTEEFSYRGYLQYTLASGIGFWPSALLLSAGFALAHAKNSGESLVGLLSIVLFGLLFCLFLWKRGNLWLAIGFHAGWDWGETFFYGAPDSGLLPTHNLLATKFSGAPWLTGGKAGPEASIFTPLILGVVAIVIGLVYRGPGYRAESKP